MDNQELIKNMAYLISKYVPKREELLDLLKRDIDGVKYVLSEIDKQKIQQYDINDLELIKDICFYYV